LQLSFLLLFLPAALRWCRRGGFVHDSMDDATFLDETSGTDQYRDAA
jgi:hypothetical protein